MLLFYENPCFVEDETAYRDAADSSTRVLVVARPLPEERFAQPVGPPRPSSALLRPLLKRKPLLVFGYSFSGAEKAVTIFPAEIDDFLAFAASFASEEEKRICEGSSSDNFPRAFPRDGAPPREKLTAYGGRTEVRGSRRRFSYSSRDDSLRSPAIARDFRDFCPASEERRRRDAARFRTSTSVAARRRDADRMIAETNSRASKSYDGPPPSHADVLLATLIDGGRTTTAASRSTSDLPSDYLTTTRGSSSRTEVRSSSAGSDPPPRSSTGRDSMARGAWRDAPRSSTPASERCESRDDAHERQVKP